MATFAFADIHGRREELDKLLAYINYQESDELVFLGDYVDRGPDSKGVIDKLLELQINHNKSYFLKGNHEEMMLTAKHCEETREVWLYCGGDATQARYSDGIPESHWQFLSTLKLFHESADAIFVHAQVEQDRAMNGQNEEVLLWDKLRTPLRHQSGKKIICGHTTQILGVPALLGDARVIDCMDWLTAINVDSDRIYQVNNEGTCRQFDITDGDKWSNRKGR